MTKMDQRKNMEQFDIGELRLTHNPNVLAIETRHTSGYDMADIMTAEN